MAHRAPGSQYPTKGVRGTASPPGALFNNLWPLLFLSPIPVINIIRKKPPKVTKMNPPRMSGITTMCLGLMLIALSFVAPLSSGLLFIQPSDLFGDGIVGHITNNGTSPGATLHGDKEIPGDNYVIQLEREIDFWDQGQMLALDVAWFEYQAVILTGTGVKTWDTRTNTLTDWVDFNAGFEIEYGQVEIWNNGQVVIFTQHDTELNEQKDGYIFYYYSWTIDIYSADYIGGTLYISKTITSDKSSFTPDIRASINMNDTYILVGGQGFYGKWDGITWTTLDNSCVWPASVPDAFGFDRYTVNVQIVDIEPDKVKLKFKFLPVEVIERNEVWVYGVTRWATNPMLDRSDDLGQYIEVSRELDKEEIGFFDRVSEGIHDGNYPNGVTTTYWHHVPHTITDFISVDGQVWASGHNGILTGYNADNGTFDIETYQYHTPGNLPTTYGGLAIGDNGVWVGVDGSSTGVKSLGGIMVHLSKGVTDVAYHQAYGYLWTSGSNLYAIGSPANLLLSSNPVKPYSYAGILPSGNYDLYPDPGFSGWCAMTQDNDNWPGRLGFFQMKNYTANGSYTSPSMDLKLTVLGADSGDDATVHRYISGAWFDYNAIIPQGCEVQAFVTNTGGEPWQEIRAGQTVDFNVTNDLADPSLYDPYSVFAYRFDMKSDIYQRFTPEIRNVDFKLTTKAPSNAIFDVDLSWVGDALYTDVPIDFTSGSFDADNEGENLIYFWDFGDDNGTTDHWPNKAILADRPPFPAPLPPDGIDDNPLTRGPGPVWDNATHIYDYPGTYTVTLKTTDTDGHVTTKEKQITIKNRPPVAQIDQGDNYAMLIGETYRLTGSSSYDLDGSVLGFKWLAKGEYSNWLSVDFDADAVGNRSVNLWAIDNYGDQSLTSATMNITVTHGDTYPVCAFTASAWESQFNQPLTFTPIVSDRVGNVVNITWDFGDGAVEYSGPSTSPVSHIYTIPGKYIVTLSATDNKSQTTTTTMGDKEIWIKPAPLIGDWVIDTVYPTISDWKIVMRGNVIIKPGGWLPLDTCVLEFDQDYDGQFGIDVQGDGVFESQDSDLRPLYKVDKESLVYEYKYWKFVDKGDVWINHTRVKGLDLDKMAYRDGLTVLDGGNLATNFDSQIKDCKGSCVSNRAIILIGTYSTIDIENTTLATSLNGVFVNGGNNTITNSQIITHTGKGISQVNGNVLFTYNTVRGATTGGFDYYKGELDINNNTIQFSGDGFVCAGFDLSFYDNIVQGSGNSTVAFSGKQDCELFRSTFSDAGIGVYAPGGEITLLACQVQDVTTFYDAIGGGIIYVDNLLNVMVKYDGKKVTGALVGIYMDGMVLTNGSTISGGFGPVQAHYAIVTGSGVIIPVYEITIEYMGIKDNRTISMKTTHTETFEYSKPPEKPDGNGGILDKLKQYSWIGPLISALVIWAIIGITLYVKRDDPEFMDTWRNRLLGIGAVLTVLAWFIFNPPDLGNSLGYIIIVSLWVVFGIAVWALRANDWMIDNRVKVGIGLAILSVLLWLWFYASIVWLIVIGILAVIGGAIYVMARMGVFSSLSISNIGKDKDGGLGIGGALLIIGLVLIAIWVILILTDVLYVGYFWDKFVQGFWDRLIPDRGDLMDDDGPIWDKLPFRMGW